MSEGGHELPRPHHLPGAKTTSRSTRRLWPDTMVVQCGSAAAMPPTEGSKSLAADRGLTQTMRLAIRSRRAVEDHLGLGNLVRVAREPRRFAGQKVEAATVPNSGSTPLGSSRAHRWSTI